MRFFFDTEFIDTGDRIELISIGMIEETGNRQYYAESKDCDLTQAPAWISENVVPFLKKGNYIKSRKQIADELREFCGNKPEFFAYVGAYDWVALCQLYGRLLDIPSGWPKYYREIKNQGMNKPSSLITHNALDDAIWAREAWLLNRSRDNDP